MVLVGLIKRSAFAFDEAYHGGQRGGGDVDDIKMRLCRNGEGMEPTVKIFSAKGVAKSVEYHGTADNVGGVSVAVGNIDNDKGRNFHGGAARW